MSFETKCINNYRSFFISSSHFFIQNIFFREEINITEKHLPKDCLTNTRKFKG